MAAAPPPPSRKPLDVAALSGRGARHLFVRVALTRAITLASLIVLARILSPAELGTYAVVAIVVTIGSLIGDVGISGGLIQQHSDPTRRELAAAWTSQQLLALAMTAVVWAAAPLIADAAGLGSETATQIRVLSLALLLLGVARLPFAMLTRVLRFTARGQPKPHIGLMGAGKEIDRRLGHRLDDEDTRHVGEDTRSLRGRGVHIKHFPNALLYRGRAGPIERGVQSMVGAAAPPAH